MLWPQIIYGHRMAYTKRSYNCTSPIVQQKSVFIHRTLTGEVRPSAHTIRVQKNEKYALITFYRRVQMCTHT